MNAPWCIMHTRLQRRKQKSTAAEVAGCRIRYGKSDSQIVRDIIHDPAFLCQESTEATEADLAIAEDLLDTLKANWEHCAFLAANMIGERKRIIAFCNGPLFVIMLNPKIISHTGAYESEEECPSLEGKRETKRYASIVVTWQDTEMKHRTATLDGFAARLVQHAIDHCNGILV